MLKMNMPNFQLSMCRAGLSLSAYNYDSTYGKKALMMMYRGIMEQVLSVDMMMINIVFLFYEFL